MPNPNLHRIIDCDDHATQLDVVVVPEGFSFQMAERERDPDNDRPYLSVIVSPREAERLLEFLQARRGGYDRTFATARGEVGPGG